MTELKNFSVWFLFRLGFQKIITIEELRSAYPYLDWVDRKRWPTKPVQDDEDFPAIEAIVMLGEPIRCVSSLQIASFICNIQQQLHCKSEISLPDVIYVMRDAHGVSCTFIFKSLQH